MSALKKKTREQSLKSSWGLLGKIPLFTIVALLLSWLALEGSRPKLYQSNATATVDLLTVTITNKGRAAQIGTVWCGAGAYLSPGKATISKLVVSSPDFFRYDTIASDQQEPLEMLLASSSQVNTATNWVVVCNLPYWDDLDWGKWFERDLTFCYEVQPAGTRNERHPVTCPPAERLAAIIELGPHAKPFPANAD